MHPGLCMGKEEKQREREREEVEWLRKCLLTSDHQIQWFRGLVGKLACARLGGDRMGGDLLRATKCLCFPKDQRP